MLCLLQGGRKIRGAQGGYVTPESTRKVVGGR